MENFKKEIDLSHDLPSYPWELVDGDGQMWVILRCKMQLENEDITELGELFLEDSSCELLAQINGRALYRGILKLQAHYKSKNHFEIEMVYPEAVYDEHQAREQLGCVKECRLWQKRSENVAASDSIFSSKIYENIASKPPMGIPEMSVWKLEMPWQAWLEEGEIVGQPEIVAAHLGQIGMGTLLCEVLLNFRAEGKEKLSSNSAGVETYLAGEEVTFNFPSGRMNKILGSAIKRAFYQIKPGKLKSLDLEYLTKVNLLYISAELGGERILSASALIPEYLNLPVPARPVFAPFIVKLKNDKVTLVRTNEKKVLLKDHYIVTLVEEIQVRAPELNMISPSKPEELNQTSSPDGDAPKIRSRPGEKWLKQKKERTNPSCCQKKVLVIKFDTR